jgi:hypothetical protein
VQITNQNTLSWDVNDYQGNQVSNGIFAYQTWYATTFADGSGGTIGTGSDTSASTGQIIYSDNFYDPSSGTVYYQVIYDGAMGSYVTYSPTPF